MDIKNKIVLITGASSGIGEATARAMAKKGANVLLTARTKEALDKIVSEIQQSGGTASAVAVDLTDAAAVEKAAAAIRENTGIPDIIVNNAGIGRWLSVDETSFSEVQQMMAAPYFSAFFTTKCFLADMLKRNSGFIINITSPAAYVAIPGATAYTASRWAMRGFSKALEADLRQTGIKVCLVVPGKVSSSYFANNPGSEERIPAISNIYKTLSPEEVANIIINAIEKNKKEVVVPYLMKMTMYFHRMFPGIMEWMVASTGLKKNSYIR